MKRIRAITIICLLAMHASAQNISIGTKNTATKDAGVATFANNTFCLKEPSGTDKACLNAPALSGDITLTTPATTGTLAILADVTSCSNQPALTGDVTTSSCAAAIANNAVTLAKMATVATASFLGRTTAGTGSVEALTATQSTALLNAMVGDSGSGGTKGLVPAPATGDATKVLSGAGTWIAPSGTPGGSTTQIQYNNAGAFGGSSSLTWDNTNERFAAGEATSSLGDFTAQFSRAGHTWNSALTQSTVVIYESDNTNRRMVLDYDHNANRGIIAAGENGVGWKTLALQPVGGPVTIGSTSSSETGILLSTVTNTNNGVAVLYGRNSNAGSSAKTQLALQNDAAANIFRIDLYSSGVASSNLQGANVALIENENGNLALSGSSKVLIGSNSGANTGSEKARFTAAGLSILTLADPTAYLHLAAGSAVASTAPLKFTSGSLNTTAEAGAVEFLTDKFYGTITTGPARKEFALMDAVGTAGSVYFAGTNGRLTQDNANFFWDDTNNRIGIGTASPQELIHTLGATNGLVAHRLENTTAGTAARAALRMYTDEGLAATVQVLSSSWTPIVYTAASQFVIAATKAGGVAIWAEHASGVVDIGAGGTATTTRGIRIKSGVYQSSGYTVATLPAAPGAGAHAHVTDQLTACAGIGVALTGGGAVTCPAFYNGAAWVGG